MLDWNARDSFLQMPVFDRRQAPVDQSVDRHATGFLTGDPSQDVLSPRILRLRDKSSREHAILRSRELASTEEHVGVARYFKRCVINEGKLKDAYVLCRV
jgi:hypothetical protein